MSCGDVERLRLLGAALSRDWDHYQAVLNTTITCAHQDHRGTRGTRERTVASMTMDVLSESAWLPAAYDRSVVIKPPGEVWLRAVGLPAAVRRHLTFLDSELDTAETAHVWTALGVADAARPTAAHLIRLLHKLAAEPVADADLADVARWAMRQLNDALADDTGTHRILESDVPLLAVLDGYLIFHPRPYVVDDHVIKEIWGDLYPILAADAGLSALTQRLNLPRLADQVHFEPSVSDHLPQESIDLRHELTAALPYLAAVAIAAAPSRRNRIRGRLQRVEVIACRYLELTSTVDEHTRHHPVTAYAHRQRDAEGKPNTVVYLQLDTDTSTPDWYALGPRLADLLEMPAHADALTLLLAADPSQREAYLRSRGIAPPDHIQDEIDEKPEMEPRTVPRPSPAASPPGDTDTKPGTSAQTALAQTTPATPRSSMTAGPGQQFPPLDNTVYRMSEPAPAMADNANGEKEANSSVQTSLPLPAVREPSANRASPHQWHDDLRTADDLKLAREYGKRGEEWAYMQERQRLQQRGLDPDRAVWVSRSNESANHDLRSIDDDGEEIFIEVKATSSADPTARFEITGNELAMAHRYHHRYFIYHVLEVRSPVPVVIRYRDPLGLVAQGFGQIHTSRAQMHLDVPGVEVVTAHPEA